jgi:hypothetical protein
MRGRCRALLGRRELTMWVSDNKVVVFDDDDDPAMADDVFG